MTTEEAAEIYAKKLAESFDKYETLYSYFYKREWGKSILDETWRFRSIFSLNN